MTYTLWILLIYYPIAYFLFSLMSTALESVSQNVPKEVLIANKGKMVICRKGLGDQIGLAYTELRKWSRCFLQDL